MSFQHSSTFRIGLIVFPLLIGLPFPSAHAQKTRTPASAGRVTVITGQAGSVVFINEVRHGVTNDGGLLELGGVRAGSYPVRVRSVGYFDWKGRISVIAGATRTLEVVQRRTSDSATHHYQKADLSRDHGKNDEAAQEYKQALELRPVFPEARVGLARSLISLVRYDEAEKQLYAAMKDARRPLAEARTVLANLRRRQGLIEEAIDEYRKALRIARGMSPEAHIGLAIALEEAGEKDGSIREYRVGIAQDMDTEPILYYLLGSALEKYGRKKEAIDAYGGYLRLDPEGQYASAVESMIERLKEELTDRL